MNERWVCKRCYADNDAPAPQCARCGLLRGAEVSDADRAAWTAASGSAQPSQGRSWLPLLRFWWIPVIVIVAAVGWFTAARRADDGSLTSAGTVNVDELRVGDCFTTGDDVEISDVHGVPCTEPHGYEVFAVLEHQGELPASDLGMQTLFLDLCSDAFGSYVGEPWESSVIYGSMISPSDESYAQGDRGYICVLYEPDPNDPSQDLVLTESLRGAAR